MKALSSAGRLRQSAAAVLLHAALAAPLSTAGTIELSSTKPAFNYQINQLTFAPEGVGDGAGNGIRADGRYEGNTEGSVPLAGAVNWGLVTDANPNGTSRPAYQSFVPDANISVGALSLIINGTDVAGTWAATDPDFRLTIIDSTDPGGVANIVKQESFRVDTSPLNSSGAPDGSFITFKFDTPVALTQGTEYALILSWAQPTGSDATGYNNIPAGSSKQLVFDRSTNASGKYRNGAGDLARKGVFEAFTPGVAIPPYTTRTVGVVDRDFAFGISDGVLLTTPVVNSFALASPGSSTNSLETTAYLFTGGTGGAAATESTAGQQLFYNINIGSGDTTLTLASNAPGFVPPAPVVLTTSGSGVLALPAIATPGVYTFTLTATNLDGASNSQVTVSIDQPFVVGAPPATSSLTVYPGETSVVPISAAGDFVFMSTEGAFLKLNTAGLGAPIGFGGALGDGDLTSSLRALVTPKFSDTLAGPTFSLVADDVIAALEAALGAPLALPAVVTAQFEFKNAAGFVFRTLTLTITDDILMAKFVPEENDTSGRAFNETGLLINLPITGSLDRLFNEVPQSGEYVELFSGEGVTFDYSIRGGAVSDSISARTPTLTTDDRTFGLWVKLPPLASATGTVILDLGGNGSGTMIGFNPTANAGQGEIFALLLTGGSGATPVRLSAPYSEGWTHIALAVDLNAGLNGGNFGSELYIDGVPSGNPQVFNSPSLAGGNGMAFFANNGGVAKGTDNTFGAAETVPGLNGELGAIFIYRGVLDAAAILDLSDDFLGSNGNTPSVKLTVTNIARVGNSLAITASVVNSTGNAYFDAVSSADLVDPFLPVAGTATQETGGSVTVLVPITGSRNFFKLRGPVPAP